LLLTNPRISTLAAMSKVFAPLSPQSNRDLLKILSVTNEFDLLPEWVVVHLTQVEQMFEQDKSDAIAKHGKHDQKTHGNNRRATFESPAFSDDEYDALTSYSGSATVQINHQLRGFSRTRGIQPAQGAWRLSEEKINKIVKKMDSAIDKSVLSERLTLEREIKEDSLRSGLFSTIKGKTISDKGFLSLRKGKSNLPPLRGFVKMRIVAPAGSKALDLSFINANSMGEVIFPRDTKIKVTQILGQGEDTTVIGEIVG
jgi:hypothetical protein